MRFLPAVTMKDVRAQLEGRSFRPQPFVLLDAIEKQASIDPWYADQLSLWLSGDMEYSTVHLRDVLCAPLRLLPEVYEYGKQFNPTTEWDNTWMPIDTAAYRAMLGADPTDW